MRSRLPVSLIAACSLNRVIGRGGKLPWSLPSDWAFFATATRQQVLLVGRRSFEEFGAPVPDRHTIVVSRSQARSPPHSWGGVHVAESLDHALEIAGTHPRYAMCSRVFVGGGEQLYEEALTRDLVASALVTRVQRHIPDGDAFLPPWTRRLPTLAFCRNTRCSSTGTPLSFQLWVR